MKPYSLALTTIMLLDAALFYMGLQIFFIPKIYMVARQNNPFLYYEGHILIVLALILAWFHKWAAGKLLWICQEVHRLLSVLVMACVVGAEGFMHMFNIPHLEGWWIPMVGGGAFISAIAAWLHKWKKKPKD